MSTSSTSASGLDPELPALQNRIAELECERAELERARQIQFGASRVLEKLGSGASLVEILDALVESVETVKPEMIGSVLLLEGNQLRLGAAPRLPGFYNEAIDGLVIGPDVGSCGTCAYTGERIIVEDVMTHPYWARYRKIAEQADLRACWSHPIGSSTGRILGTFAMYYREPRRPEPSDLELITFAAHLAGVAIERTRTETALRSSEQRLRALIQSAPVCIHEIDLDGDLVSMNAVGLRLIGASDVSEVIGKAFLDCVSADDRQRVSRLLEASFNGVPAEFEFVSSVHDPPRVFATSLVPLRNNEGGVVRVMGVAQDITERKDAERQQGLMLQELNHRVKNNLAAVISIARQTAEQVESVPEFETALSGRLRSMGIAHEMLAEARWEGVQLGDMLARILDPYRRDDASRIALTGPAIMLPATVATPVCMVVHELAVNAVKYGSLSNSAGRVDVVWEVEQVEGPTEHLTFSWRETGGPPVAMPSRSGRGTLLIERMVNYQLHGEATIDFESTGVRCRMTMPLDRGTPPAGTECTP